MAGAVRTGDREEPISSDANSSVTSMREAGRSPARGPQAVESGPALSTFTASWQLALEATAKSLKTVRSYTDSVRWLCRYLDDEGLPASVEVLAAGVTGGPAADLAGTIGRTVLGSLMPLRRLRTIPRVVKRAISKYNARGTIDRKTYKATLDITILASPLTTSGHP
jgi:hypothetical protein